MERRRKEPCSGAPPHLPASRPRYSRALLMICLMMRSVPTRVLSLLLSSLGRRKASTRSGNEQAAGSQTNRSRTHGAPGTACRREIWDAGTASHPAHPHGRRGIRGGAELRLRPRQPTSPANRPILHFASRPELFSGAFRTFPTLSRELKEFKLYLPTSAAPSAKTF